MCFSKSTTRNGNQSPAKLAHGIHVAVKSLDNADQAVTEIDFDHPKKGGTQEAFPKRKNSTMT